VINNTFAGGAGLSLSKDAIYQEGADSPYANLIVVRQKDENDPRFKQLAAVYHSPEVIAKARQLFGEGGAIPAKK
jgi:D-methionine transport system substrate-binding protein